MSSAPKRAKADVNSLRSRFTDLFDPSVPSAEDEPVVPVGTPNTQPQPIQTPSPSFEEELQRERELRLQAEQKLANLVNEQQLRLSAEEKLQEKEDALKNAKRQIDRTQQKNQQLTNQIKELNDALQTAQKQATETAVTSEVPVEIDADKFLLSLKTQYTTRSRGTSHYVAQEVDDWLEGVRSEFHIFGRKQGPNMAHWYWNMGVMLLAHALSRTPDWHERVRGLAHSPDLALAEIWKIALSNITKSN